MHYTRKGMGKWRGFFFEAVVKYTQLDGVLNFQCTRSRGSHVLSRGTCCAQFVLVPHLTKQLALEREEIMTI